MPREKGKGICETKAFALAAGRDYTRIGCESNVRTERFPH